ncbi:hypothetical protein KUCAC02_001115 [Chaenocephalus aceratus]|uniref:Uncharacterized protein n=1 Tax=Chaenocephalus aceratus TaxID=36190 RepID=A0ACB9XXN0_CHAAC|nr:hypothetical protein KUCAC02_001115 [Chaenocephalus aceratus]
MRASGGALLLRPPSDDFTMQHHQLHRVSEGGRQHAEERTATTDDSFNGNAGKNGGQIGLHLTPHICKAFHGRQGPA